MNVKEYSAQCSAIGARWMEVFGKASASSELKKTIAPFGIEALQDAKPEMRREILSVLESTLIEAQHDR